MKYILKQNQTLKTATLPKVKNVRSRECLGVVKNGDSVMKLATHFLGIPSSVEEM